MRIRLLFWLDRLRTSYWFLPALMSVFAVAAALGTVRVDHGVRSDRLEGIWWLFGGGPEGARAVLSTVAGSMITVAGVVFSIMMVVLSLAAQQYGPRLLRNFMRDRLTQSVLGLFVATFLYCLMVLRTIRGQDGSEFVPQISVTTGILLTLASLGVLIYFIHHVSVSIQIGQIISRVQVELLAAIDDLFPEEGGQNPAQDVDGSRQLPEGFAERAAPLAAISPGYVEAVALDRLIELAKEHDLIVKLVTQPGDFVLSKQVVMHVWPPAAVGDELRRELQRVLLIGQQRTPVQDVMYALDQQTDIAIRALSPGINDPFTAANCIDFLVEALSRIAQRQMPSPWRCDDQQRLRVVAPSASFAAMLEASLGRIRQYCNAPSVAVKLIDALAQLATHVQAAKDGDEVRQQISAIATVPWNDASNHDRQRIKAAIDRALQFRRQSDDLSDATNKEAATD